MRWAVLGCAVVGLACSESSPAPDDAGMAGASSIECETELVRDACAVISSVQCATGDSTLAGCLGTLSTNRCGPLYDCVAEYDALLGCLSGGSMVCIDDQRAFTGADCRTEGAAFATCMDFGWLCSNIGVDGECACGRASTAGSDDAACPPPPTTGCCWERLDGNACHCSPDPEVCQAYADASISVETCPPP